MRQAYDQLATRPGDWVSVTEFRRALGDMPREEVDDTLRRLTREGVLSIAPNDYQDKLSPADRDAAVRMGGRDNHLLRWSTKEGLPTPTPEVPAVVVAPLAAEIAAKEAELEAARQRFQAAADYQAGGSNKKITFVRRMDAALARAGQAGRDIERLENELSALRRRNRPQAPPATQEDIDNLAPDDLIKLKNGLVYRVVKVNKATVKVKVEPGMDDLMPKSKIVRVQKAGASVPAATPAPVVPDAPSMPAPVDERRAANLDKARAAKREKRVEELRDSTDPKDNAAKIKALAEDKIDSITLYRKANVSPNATYGRADIAVARISHKPDNPSGEFQVRDPRSGDLAGWMDRVPFDGEMMWAVRRERADGGFEFKGYAESMAIGADVLVTDAPNERFLASTVSNTDSRRVSTGRFVTPEEALKIRDREARTERERLATVAAERMRGAVDTRTVEDLPNYTIDRLLDSQSVDPEIAQMRMRAMAERIRRDSGTPFREGQRVMHSTRGEVTYNFPDEAKRDGTFSWVEFDDGNGGIVMTDSLSPLPTEVPTPPTALGRATLVGKSVEAGDMRKGDVIESISGNKRTVSYVDDQGRAHFAEGGRTIPGGRYKVLSVADEPAAPSASDEKPGDLAAEMKRVKKHTQHLTAEQRSDRAASHRLTPGQKRAVLEEFYSHPDIPDRGFASRREAAVAALRRRERGELDTSRVKRDDEGMTTTAPKAAHLIDFERNGPGESSPETLKAVRDDESAPSNWRTQARAEIARRGRERNEQANAGEPALGIRTTSAGRETTVTLPDGTTEKRTSKTREYTHAVVATTDLHGVARRRQAANDRRRAFVEAFEAWRARGSNFAELKAYASANLSVADERRGMSKTEYYLPGFEPTRETPRGGRAYWSDNEQFSLPDPNDKVQLQRWSGGSNMNMVDSGKTRFDEFDPDRFIALHRDIINREQSIIDKLAAGPQHSYGVVRWSMSADNAFKALGSFDDRETRYEVIAVGGTAVHKEVKVKTGPTAEEKAAAKLAKAEAEKADRAKRNEEWVQRKVATIRRGLAEGNESFARSEVISTNDQGLRMIARAFGIKSTPRGMGDREKTEWLRNAILEAAKTPAPLNDRQRKVVDNGTRFSGNPYYVVRDLEALTDADFAGLTSDQQENVRFVLRKLAQRQGEGETTRAVQRLQQRFGS